MVDEGYLKNFVPGAIVPYTHKDDDGGVSTCFRLVTQREHALHREIDQIRKGVSTIFQLGKSTDVMLTEIECDLAALEAKVKRYAEGAT